MEKILAKLKEFWLQNEQKVVLVLGFGLIAAVSFGFGAFWAQKKALRPLVIEKPSNGAECSQTAQNGDSGTPGGTQQGLPQASQGSLGATQAVSKAECAFVGSKNSDKFYVPTCSYAKRVKPENLACYKSEQEALAKGKVKSTCK